MNRWKQKQKKKFPFAFEQFSIFYTLQFRNPKYYFVRRLWDPCSVFVVVVICHYGSLSFMLSFPTNLESPKQNAFFPIHFLRLCTVHDVACKMVDKRDSQPHPLQWKLLYYSSVGCKRRLCRFDWKFMHKFENFTSVI